MNPTTLTFPPTMIARTDQFRPEPRRSVPLVNSINVRKKITPSEVSIVIAVKDNQAGIARFLRSINAEVDIGHYPREVIIVDNNSDEKVTVKEKFPFPVVVLECKKPGPGPARNVGAGAANGCWILFTDSDCVATPTLISGYCREDNDCVAYAGMVKLRGNDALTRYYRDQNVFIPLALLGVDGPEPWAVVTANCLVLKSAFTAIGGFNECFTHAGGEDTDLGFRLRRVGKIRYNYDSVALHEISDGLEGFINRFIRYGKGNKLLDEHYSGGLFNLRRIEINNPTASNKFLADLQLKAMAWGYKGMDAAKFPTSRYLRP